MYRDLGREGAAAARPIRCAVYTRKSTDEGLDQAFNSLDAQREACEAYIASQRHEGWSLVPDHYDDGGFSGGSMERPSLKRLLGDVAAGKVDVIVLYKIDRLTRALSDFARIVEVLDKAGASFVSVTQAFNTTTSMGRLTLNVLLSFAQFEREVGAERVRDKIAASKRKGMWMGGVVPLGYRVEARKLLAVDSEVDTVRLIYELYLGLGSVTALEAELDRRDIRSRSGRPFSRGALYLMLANRIYVGEICHRGSPFPGEHSAILDRHLFDRAQSLLATNRTQRHTVRNADDPSLLAGILYDHEGRRMSPTHACKGVRRYRYYASRNDGPSNRRDRVRVPAAAIDDLVVGRLASYLQDQHAVHESIDVLQLDAIAAQATLFAASRAGSALLDDASHDSRRLLLMLIDAVVLAPDEVRITVHLPALLSLAEIDGLSTELTTTLIVSAKLVRRAREVRLAVPPPAAVGSTNEDAGLIKLLVKAYSARSALFAGQGASLAEVASAQEYDPGYFAVLVKLAYLAPGVTDAILHGRQAPSLTRQKLARRRDLPMLWSEQHKLMASWS